MVWSQVLREIQDSHSFSDIQLGPVLSLVKPIMTPQMVTYMFLTLFHQDTLRIVDRYKVSLVKEVLWVLKENKVLKVKEEEMAQMDYKALKVTLALKDLKDFKDPKETRVTRETKVTLEKLDQEDYKALWDLKVSEVRKVTLET